MPEVKNVAIAGVGGIGAFLADLLYDYGFTRKQFECDKWNISIFDDDTVDASNLLHQGFHPDDLGRFKTDIVCERCPISGGKSLFTPEKRFMTKDDFKKFDVIFSCVDGLDFRKDLYNYGWDNPKKVFWLDGRCSSRTIGIFSSTVPKDSIDEAALTGSSERRGCLLAQDKSKKISHATPRIVAGILIQLFMNHLRGEDLLKPLVLHI